MKTIRWLLFSHLKVYFEISKIKISHFPYECMLRDLSALCPVLPICILTMPFPTKSHLDQTYAKMSSKLCRNQWTNSDMENYGEHAHFGPLKIEKIEKK